MWPGRSHPSARRSQVCLRRRAWKPSTCLARRPEQGLRHAGLGAKKEATAPARLEDTFPRRPLSSPQTPCATSSGGTKGCGASKTGSNSSANPATAASCTSSATSRAAAWPPSPNPSSKKESSSSARIETSSLPALRLFWYLATPRLGLGASSNSDSPPGPKGTNGHCVHSELAHGPGAVLQLQTNALSPARTSPKDACTR